MKPKVSKGLGGPGSCWRIRLDDSIDHWEPTFTKLQAKLNTGQIRELFEAALIRRTDFQAYIRQVRAGQ